jgi:hypothetical protein
VPNKWRLKSARDVVSLPSDASATAVTTLKSMSLEKCLMNKVEVEYSLEDILASKDDVFVHFYSSWYLFPTVLAQVRQVCSRQSRPCARVSTDDKASLFEKDFVEVVPTILGIRKGKIAIWLDAVSGED